jgi:hypothetical protein
MKTQKPAEGKHARKLSDAVIEKRYLYLQKLRNAVRIAEMNRAPQNLKQPEPRKPAVLAASTRPNSRPNIGGPR